MPAHSVNYITNDPIARFKEKKPHASTPRALAGETSVYKLQVAFLRVCVLETHNNVFFFLFMSDISTVSVSAVSEG